MTGLNKIKTMIGLNKIKTLKHNIYVVRERKDGKGWKKKIKQKQKKADEVRMVVSIMRISQLVTMNSISLLLNNRDWGNECQCERKLLSHLSLYTKTAEIRIILNRLSLIGEYS